MGLTVRGINEYTSPLLGNSYLQSLHLI